MPNTSMKWKMDKILITNQSISMLNSKYLIKYESYVQLISYLDSKLEIFDQIMYIHIN